MNNLTKLNNYQSTGFVMKKLFISISIAYSSLALTYDAPQEINFVCNTRDLVSGKATRERSIVASIPTLKKDRTLSLYHSNRVFDVDAIEFPRQQAGAASHISKS
jgi:hypothetical protein